MKYLALLSALLLIGCSQDSADDDEDSVLLESAKAPIDKAESVEDTILEAQERRDEAIDEAED